MSWRKALFATNILALIPFLLAGCSNSVDTPALATAIPTRIVQTASIPDPTDAAVTSGPEPTETTKPSKPEPADAAVPPEPEPTMTTEPSQPLSADTVMPSTTAPMDTAAPTADSLTGPDLVIQSFIITNPDWLVNGFAASAEVVVKNVGNMPASGFDVGIVSVNREDNRRQFDFDYDPTLTTELSAGQEVKLAGTTGLAWHVHFDIYCFPDDYDASECAMRDLDTLWLMAIADYCEEDEEPQHCAIEEIDEANNTKAKVIERVK